MCVCVCARLLGRDGFIYRVSKRKPFSIIYIYYIHPELGIGNLPFRFEKGSRVALKGATREHRGSRREQWGAAGESKRSVIRWYRWRSRWELELAV